MFILLRSFSARFPASRSPSPPRVEMSTELEARVTRIEDGLAEWNATTRTRWEGLTALEKRMCDLFVAGEGGALRAGAS